MSSEFLRITTQLSTLQQQILRNELPQLLSSISPYFSTSSYPQLLISGVLNINRAQLINPIIKSMQQIKHENTLLKKQSNELKQRLKSQQQYLTEIEQIIKNINIQKNNLYNQLQDLRLKYNILSQNIYENDLQTRIYEIAKQNQCIKKQNNNLNFIINNNNFKISEFLQQQIYFKQQIYCITNNYTLLLNSFNNQNQQIINLKQINHLFKDNQEKSILQFQFTKKQMEKQIVQLKQQLKIFKEFQNMESQHIIEKQKVNINQEKQNGNNQIVSLEEQNKQLRISLDKMTKQQQTDKYTIQQLSQKLKTAEQSLQTLTSTLTKTKQTHSQLVDNIAKQNKDAITTYTNDINSLKQQIINNQIKYRDIIEKLNKYQQQNQQKIGNNYEVNYQKNNKQLEQQYINIINQLNKQLTLLKQQLSKQQQNKNQATNDNQQFKQFKNSSHLKIIQKQQYKNYIYKILQFKQQIKFIKKQYIQLKSIISNIIQSNKKIISKQIDKLVKLLMEYKIPCITCQDRQKHQNNKIIIGKNKQQSQPKSRKDIKILNQRYKLIIQQNDKVVQKIHKMIYH